MVWAKSPLGCSDELDVAEGPLSRRKRQLVLVADQREQYAGLTEEVQGDVREGDVLLQHGRMCPLHSSRWDSTRASSPRARAADSMDAVAGAAPPPGSRRRSGAGTACPRTVRRRGPSRRGRGGDGGGRHHSRGTRLRCGGCRGRGRCAGPSPRPGRAGCRHGCGTARGVSGRTPPTAAQSRWSSCRRLPVPAGAGLPGAGPCRVVLLRAVSRSARASRRRPLPPHGPRLLFVARRRCVMRCSLQGPLPLRTCWNSDQSIGPKS